MLRNQDFPLVILLVIAAPVGLNLTKLLEFFPFVSKIGPDI